MHAPAFTYIELEHVNPAKNMHRYYRLAWESDLLGQACLVRAWGRKGSPKRQRVTHFPTWSAAWPTLRAAAHASTARLSRRGWDAAPSDRASGPQRAKRR